MQTIRWRLTVYYGLALTATVAVFGAVIYAERRSSLVEEANLRLSDRLGFELEASRRYIERNAANGGRVVITGPSFTDPALLSVEIAPDIRPFLDAVTDAQHDAADRHPLCCL